MMQSVRVKQKKRLSRCLRTRCGVFFFFFYGCGGRMQEVCRRCLFLVGSGLVMCPPNNAHTHTGTCVASPPSVSLQHRRIPVFSLKATWDLTLKIFALIHMNGQNSELRIIELFFSESETQHHCCRSFCMDP